MAGKKQSKGSSIPTERLTQHKSAPAHVGHTDDRRRTVFSAALDANAADNEAANAFIKAISSPAAAAAYEAKGLDPG
jgi:hypothetical protein